MQPMSLPVLGHPHHIPDWDWKGPSPFHAVLWRNRYFTTTFSMGFVGRESLFGPCQLLELKHVTLALLSLGELLMGLPTPALKI